MSNLSIFKTNKTNNLGTHFFFIFIQRPWISYDRIIRKLSIASSKCRETKREKKYHRLLSFWALYVRVLTSRIMYVLWECARMQRTKTCSRMCSFVGACACCRVKVPRVISYDNLLVSRFSCMANIMHDASYSTTFVKKDIGENAYYESDKRYIMQFPRMVLTPIGIWPLLKAQVSKTERFLSFVFLVTCFVLMCFILIPSTINILVLENDINVLTKNIGPTIFCFSSAIKYFYFAWHRRDLRICIEYVENDWKAVREKEDRVIMLKHAILGRRLTKLSAIFLYTGGISFHTIMPFIAGRRIVGNMTVRTFIYNGYDIFFDSQTSPSYEIVLSIHCFTAVIMYNITTASCSLAAVFVTHVCARIEIVMSRINDLVGDIPCNHEYINYRLATIVREHVNVLRYYLFCSMILTIC